MVAVYKKKINPVNTEIQFHHCQAQSLMLSHTTLQVGNKKGLIGSVHNTIMVSVSVASFFLFLFLWSMNISTATEIQFRSSYIYRGCTHNIESTCWIYTCRCIHALYV